MLLRLQHRCLRSPAAAAAELESKNAPLLRLLERLPSPSLLGELEWSASALVSSLLWQLFLLPLLYKEIKVALSCRPEPTSITRYYNLPVSGLIKAPAV